MRDGLDDPPDGGVAPAGVTAAGEAPAPEAGGWRWWPLLALVGMAAFLAAFLYYGRHRSPIRFGAFSHPPIYGVWDPTWDPLTLVVVPAALLLAGVGWAVTASRRIPSWAVLGLVVGGGVLVATAVGLVRGDWHDLVRGVSTDENSPYYTSDLHFLDELGVRGFAERHPEMTTQLHSYNSRTHPPGIHIFLYGLFRLVGAEHSLRIAVIIAVLALAAAVNAWAIGRLLGGERAGRIAAVLFVAAPGPLLLAYSSMDMIFALVISGSVALFVLAIHRRSTPVAAVAGAVLGLATLLTFATSFIALAATVAVLVQTRSARASVRLLGASVAGGLAVVVLARLTLGIDVLASYRSSPGAERAYDPYWIVASPSAWLIYAGLPLAALGVVALFRPPLGSRRAVLPLVLVLIMVVWASLPPVVTKLRPGEVERTWAFLYPLVAASAGLLVDRWSRGLGRWSGPLVAGLVLLSVGQAVLISGLWDNLN
ncbi:glycosyltransferase family 39 protein [Micromonospora eburnea]|uniref:Dolichyl-phosphate-mannose-protein mannosyltransferase n=1 Tax=Micromonospora eburnea TaxID=227316 RepID=A0A1C6U3M1_9ACTN|nr:glycosyltransferase family 39 protein [Micromonospora eburnea]SCL48637.1 Dolichyl-phosphate-mannose-protein mannosyltransferase [Micromonospora eburnea]